MTNPSSADTPLSFDFQASAAERFHQSRVAPEERGEQGFQGLLKRFFPITTSDGVGEMIFRSYMLEPPRYDEDECRRRGFVLASPLKVTIELLTYEPADQPDGDRVIRDIKQQEVYFGELPLLTERGTFIVHGVDRVPLLRLSRTPGVRHATAPDGSPAAEITLRRDPRLLLWIDRQGAWQAAWGEDVTFPGTRLFRAYGIDPDTLEACDPTTDQVELCRILSPGDAADDRRAGRWFERAFLTGQALDLSRLGRLWTNYALSLDVWPEADALDPRDLIAVAEVLRADRLLKDHPHEHSVRAVDDLFEAHGRQGLAEMTAKVRAMMEKVNATDSLDTFMPHDFINAKPLGKAWRAMLEKSPYVEDLDATNPLARVAHSWRVRVDEDAVGALERGPFAGWVRAERPGYATLSPSTPLTELGTLDADDDAVDRRTLAERLVPVTTTGNVERMRRALPLESPEAPRERSALGAAVAERGGSLVVAAQRARVQVVNDRRVWLVPDGGGDPVLHRLRPIGAPRAASALDLRPVVREGARVDAGDVLAEGAAVVAGELALGRYCTVTHASDLPAGRCRVSSRMRRAFRSVHVERVDAVLSDTKLGRQRFLREVPLLDGFALRHLDASGLAELGADVDEGDVLAGRVSPVAFTDGAAVEDASVRSLARGRVVGVEIFARRGVERSARHESIVRATQEDLDAERDERIECTAEARGVAPEEVADEVRSPYDERRWNLGRGDDLPPGVIELVRFELLVTRDLACGDLLASREGECWTVDAIADEVAMTADVALPGDAAGGELYLLKLAPEPSPAPERPAKKRAKKSAR